MIYQIQVINYFMRILFISKELTQGIRLNDYVPDYFMMSLL